MDLLAMVLSVEVTRREARSALPGAAVEPPRQRWWTRIRASRRAAGGS
ncbi:hypothetical protein [Paractinoplanes atraurantiacus]|nr:hypothetical protein [Actinoplanes atraurantiacus]